MHTSDIHLSRLPRTADLVVVGGGTAGIVAAKTAAGFGAKVVLIERDRTGGDCLWTGCVPSKALIAAASAAATARRGHALGVDVDGVSVDFARVMKHVHGAIETIEPVDSPKALTDAGVVVVDGSAVFTGARTLSVGDRTLTFGRAIVTTGARAATPPIQGLDRVEYMTSESLWELTELPARLCVLGGGNIGCELSQAFARLGSQVTVVESASSVLSHGDPDAARVLTESMTADGVDVRTSASATSVEPGIVVLDDGTRIEFDRLLVATGRSPRTDSLGLDVAGVELDDRGFVVVDDTLRTSNPHVWAAGDLTAKSSFTHTAGMHGSIAATNAVLGVRRAIDTSGAPHVTFTDPEIAVVGVDTVSAGRTDGLHVRTLAHDEVDRPIAEGRTAGFTKLVIDGKHRIVGALVVGPRAGETLGELALAVKQGMRTRDLAGVTHPYPTYNDAPWNAAIADVRGQLAAPVVKYPIRALAKVRATLTR
ncbi:MAG: FAD-dependent oxidoreductase [Rhodococcus sp. (in: high G+C Gram-positive bacteria)]